MDQEITLTAFVITAALTGILHTLAGPDHYLPFIAISKSRDYGLAKTCLWTLICGIGHVGSSLILAGIFLVFSGLLSEAKLEWLNDLRGNIAAYAMVGMGAALLIHSLYRRWTHRPQTHRHAGPDGCVLIHTHPPVEMHGEEKISFWIVFIIFVLGPCEAMLPLLTASAVMGKMSVLLVSIVFSTATIATMMLTVIAGRFGLTLCRIPLLERFAPEIAGGTVLCCGLAILRLGL